MEIEMSVKTTTESDATQHRLDSMLSENVVEFPVSGPRPPMLRSCSDFVTLREIHPQAVDVSKNIPLVVPADVAACGCFYTGCGCFRNWKLTRVEGGSGEIQPIVKLGLW